MDQMARILTHKFSDLPLIIDGAFEDNGVEGEAEIAYWADGQWRVESVSITTSRRKTDAEMELTGLSRNRIYRQHVLDRASPISAILCDRLTTGKYTRMNIQDEVNEAIEEAREDAAGFLADRRHDERMGAM